MNVAREAREIAPKPFELECGHVVRFRMAPQIGDPVLCTKCGDYRLVGPVAVTVQKTYHLNGWITLPVKGGKIRSECTNNGCTYRMTHRSFWRLRDDFEIHYLLEHANSSLNWTRTEIPTPKRLPRDAPAPF